MKDNYIVVESPPPLKPVRIRVDVAAEISGLSSASIRKAISKKLFKSGVYCLGKGRNGIRLIDYESFVAFLNNLPEDLN